jgi:hypothetical protein
MFTIPDHLPRNHVYRSHCRPFKRSTRRYDAADCWYGIWLQRRLADLRSTDSCAVSRFALKTNPTHRGCSGSPPSCRWPYGRTQTGLVGKKSRAGCVCVILSRYSGDRGGRSRGEGEVPAGLCIRRVCLSAPQQ